MSRRFAGRGLRSQSLALVLVPVIIQVTSVSSAGTAVPSSETAARLKGPHLSARVGTEKASVPIHIANGRIGLSVNERLGFQIHAYQDLTHHKYGSDSEEGSLSDVKLKGSLRSERFTLAPGTLTKKVKHSAYGKCEAVTFNARSEDGHLSERVEFLSPLSLSNVILCQITIKNEGDRPVEVSSYRLLSSHFDARRFGADSAYKFWSFQGGSYPERFDWILPLCPTFARTNYQGMNAPDYGGGMPVVDLWTKQIGIALAVVSQKPQFISLPVTVDASGTVSESMEDSEAVSIGPHGMASLPCCALIVHDGDFYNGLRTYSALMQAGGFALPRSPSVALEPEWCAWGYERNFNKDQILRTLPSVKSLGFGWVTIDDGWQDDVGDWGPNRRVFSGGEKDFVALIDSIHSYGLKVRLWWCPMAAQDSSYSARAFPERMNEYGMGVQSNLAAEHPDWFLLDKNGSRIQVSWWNAYTLCPALPGVRAYFKSFVSKAILQWKIDGFKLDGQNLNEVPCCYNATHHHLASLESAQGVPAFFRDISVTATRLKPAFVVQLCPCGTNFSIYNLPFVNQTVASDPLNSWQVRLKGKTFRALCGDRESYSGDHVELTNRTWDPALQKFIPRGSEDFLSTLAVGGVPASKFTIAGVEQADSSLILSGDKLNAYERWLNIYTSEQMSKGEYLNLYDIGFDRPETHLIKRNDTYYYSFFTDGRFQGEVQLRGLSRGRYSASDLFRGRRFSFVRSDSPFLTLEFDRYALIKVVKERQ